MSTQLADVYGTDEVTVVAQGVLGPQGPPGPPGAGTGVGAESGSGSPEGIVTAAVGTEYVDLAATGGNVKWIKATGTGNTGWIVTETTAHSTNPIGLSALAEAAPRQAVWFPPAAAAGLRRPNVAALGGSSTIDVRWVELSLETYGEHVIVGQYLTTGNNRQFQIRRTPNRSTNLWVSTDGVEAVNSGVSGALLPEIGQWGARRCIANLATGQVEWLEKSETSEAALRSNDGWFLRFTTSIAPSGTALYAANAPAVIHATDTGLNPAINTAVLRSVVVSAAIGGPPVLSWRADAGDLYYVDPVDGRQWEPWGGPGTAAVRLVDPDLIPVAAPMPSDVGLLQVGPFEYRGSGFPTSITELSAAPIGSKYVDRDATNGAVEWRKLAAGSTGWRVAIGDTGVRKIASWTAGVQDAVGQMGTIDTSAFELTGTAYLTLRRTADDVIFGASSGTDSIRKIADSATPLFNPLANWQGFQLPNFGDKAVMTCRTTQLHFVERLGGNTFNIVSPTAFVAAGDGSLRAARAQWITVDPWPATLPGVPL